MNPTAILIVDDEQAFLDSVVRMLRLEGYNDVTPLADPTKAPELLETREFDMAFLDVTMPGLDGIELLKIIKEKSPATECVMVTANENITTAITAMKLGAYDYLVKPITPDQLVLSLKHALERKWLLTSLRLHSQAATKESLDNPEAFKEVITGHPSMLRILHEAELHATSEIPILITGDTGVGKELLARAIHLASNRHDGPFIPVNMIAISPNLFESEFFGHAKGAFTGAERERAGYMGRAGGGTLFLDEIGDLSLETQGKLLRILQEGEYVPVGKTTPQRADIRFIAATNQDLVKQVEQGKFRKDLFYRLQFAHLMLPPLKKRGDDILLLAENFVRNSSRAVDRLSMQAEEALLAHDWPGNVRELRGVLEAASNLAQEGVIELDHLRLPELPKLKVAKQTFDREDALEPLAEVERQHILKVYEAVGRNKSQAARVLEIGLQTLHRKLRSYNVK